MKESLEAPWSHLGEVSRIVSVDCFSLAALRFLVRSTSYYLNSSGRVLFCCYPTYVSIRQLDVILKAILEGMEIAEEPALLTEFVRATLSSDITQTHLTETGRVNVIRLSALSEHLIRENLDATGRVNMQFASLAQGDLVVKLQVTMDILEEEGLENILLAAPDLRFAIRQMSRGLPDLAVLSELDITPGVPLNILGEVRLACSVAEDLDPV